MLHPRLQLVLLDLKILKESKAAAPAMPKKRMMLIHRLRTRSSERYVKTTWCSPGEIGIARSEWYALRISTGVPSISAFHAGNQLSAITSSAGSSVETSRLSRFVVRSIQKLPRLLASP